MHTPITVDLTYLYSLTGGDKSFEQVLLSGTITDVDLRINNLEKAWKTGDAVEIRKNAHSLVSLSAIAGMPQVEGWSRKIDQAFSDGQLHPELTELAENIIAGWPAVKVQLEEMMAAG